MKCFTSTFLVSARFCKMSTEWQIIQYSFALVQAGQSHLTSITWGWHKGKLNYTATEHWTNLLNKTWTFTPKIAGLVKTWIKKRTIRSPVLSGGLTKISSAVLSSTMTICTRYGLQNLCVPPPCTNVTHAHVCTRRTSSAALLWVSLQLLKQSSRWPHGNMRPRLVFQWYGGKPRAVVCNRAQQCPFHHHQCTLFHCSIISSLLLLACAGTASGECVGWRRENFLEGWQAQRQRSSGVLLPFSSSPFIPPPPTGQEGSYSVPHSLMKGLGSQEEATVLCWKYKGVVPLAGEEDGVSSLWLYLKSCQSPKFSPGPSCFEEIVFSDIRWYGFADLVNSQPQLE